MIGIKLKLKKKIQYIREEERREKKFVLIYLFGGGSDTQNLSHVQKPEKPEKETRGKTKSIWYSQNY